MTYSKQAQDVTTGDRILIDGQYWTVHSNTFTSYSDRMLQLEGIGRERREVKFPNDFELTVAESND